MSSHLGVSYDDLSDASIGYIKDRISQYGYLRSYIHNHPSNMAAPSGLGTDNSQGDMLFLNNMRYVSMTHGAIDPTSFIYTSKPRKYTRYTLSSEMEDFELFNNMLNEIIINSSIK